MSSSYQEQLTAIHSKSDEFSKMLGNIQKLNNELREKSKKVLESLSDLVGRTNPCTCKVCFNEKQTHMFYPCGHGGYCIACATRAKDDRGRCYACRQRIVDVKYYI